MLSEADKEYIENHPELPPDELAEKTGKGVKEIKTFVTKNGASRNQKKLVQKTGSGVAIMQPGVSAAADEMPKSKPAEKPYITKAKK